MELIDVVDRDDRVIGQATRDEIYSKKLPHRIVHVLIFNGKGEMAMQLRGMNVSFCPGHWSTTVGGHVQSGEGYEEAALREYAEELGCTSELEFLSKDFFESASGMGKFLVTYKAAFDGPFTPGEDVDEVRFFAISEIMAMVESGEKFHPELLFLLKKHF